MKTVWRVFAYLKRYPWMAAGTLTCAILSTLMVIVFPAATKWIINDVVRASRPDKLLPLIALAATAFLLQHGFNALRIIVNNTFEQKVIFDLRSDLYSHIQLLPLRWFDNRATGDLMTRVIEDVNSVERMLIDGIEQGVVAALQVIVVLGVMFYLSWQLTLLSLLPAPFLAGGALCYTLTAHRRYRLQRRASSAMNALLHDNLAGIRQIKSFGREGEQHARFNHASNELRRATRGACEALVRPYGNGALSTCSTVKLSPRQMTGSNMLPRATTRPWNNVFNTMRTIAADQWRVDWIRLPYLGSGIDSFRQIF